MDPKTLSSLDPKLRETYERVMGTTASANTPGTTPIKADAPPTEAIQENSTPIPPPSSSAPSSQIVEETSGQTNLTLSPTPNPQSNPGSQDAPATTSVPEHLTPLPSPESVNHTATKTPSPMLRALYLIAGIIFFIVYAIFWLKIFNYPLPF